MTPDQNQNILHTRIVYSPICNCIWMRLSRPAPWFIKHVFFFQSYCIFTNQQGRIYVQYIHHYSTLFHLIWIVLMSLVWNMYSWSIRILFLLLTLLVFPTSATVRVHLCFKTCCFYNIHHHLILLIPSTMFESM